MQPTQRTQREHAIVATLAATATLPTVRGLAATATLPTAAGLAIVARL